MYKQHMEKTQDWPMIQEFVCRELMSIRWIKKEWQEFRTLWLRQHSYEDETPAVFLTCKQLHWQRLLPIFSNADPEQCILEVGNLWLHIWNACININECLTSATLIKLVTDREEQLLASLPTTSNSIVKLVRQEVQRLTTQNQGAHQQFTSHLAKVEKPPWKHWVYWLNPRAMWT